MSDAKLQKVILPPDVIDLSFGEPTVVLSALYKQLNRVGSSFKMPNINDIKDWTYQPAAGSLALTKILEEKYGAKVVVCNGAKQALASAIYSFKKNGSSSIWYRSPYYPGNPSIIESALLPWAEKHDATSQLITSPNNPDGYNLSTTALLSLSKEKVPIIHDAAYYTEIYLPKNQVSVPVGDIQVFSMSKMYGMSGLRIGYAVCYNEKYYQDMVDYVEMSTAGVSIASQDIALGIEVYFRDNPHLYEEFTDEARDSILAARKELTQLDSDVLEVMPCESTSMFAWCKKGPALDAIAAKVYILPGELFGQPGMMRMNIAHSPEVICKAVEKLNKYKIRF